MVFASPATYCVIARRGVVWKGEGAVAISWTKG
jgi:hypothetical protein